METQKITLVFIVVVFLLSFFIGLVVSDITDQSIAIKYIVFGAAALAVLSGIVLGQLTQTLAQHYDRLTKTKLVPQTDPDGLFWLRVEDKEQE